MLQIDGCKCRNEAWNLLSLLKVDRLDPCVCVRRSDETGVTLVRSYHVVDVGPLAS